MTTFRIEDGNYVPYSSAMIDDAEDKLETDLENNPHVILAPDKLLYIGRQTRTDDGRALDLLGVTSDRRPVVVELKKGRTPREMVAQALEYAAFIEASSHDDINRRAVEYFQTTGRPWLSIREAHDDFFEGLAVPDEGQVWELADEPIIVLEGQTIAPRILDVALFLRKRGIDIRVVQLSYLVSSSGERLVTITQLLQPPEDGDDTRGGSSTSLIELLSVAPAAAVFELVCQALTRMELRQRDIPSGRSYLLPRGGTIASVWLSIKRGVPGERVYLQVYAQHVPGGLDAFDNGLNSSGFRRERGTNISVHLTPDDLDRIPTLMQIFRDQCLAPAMRTASSS